jgi:hypothetical protein
VAKGIMYRRIGSAWNDSVSRVRSGSDKEQITKSIRATEIPAEARTPARVIALTNSGVRVASAERAR